jgi:cytochrome c oxidase cbb3-type subunit 2
LLVFFTYFYFLLFTQFTFLEILRQGVAEERILKTILALMAIGGIGGSFGAIALRGTLRKGTLFSPLLICCAAVSALTPFLQGRVVFGVAAVVMGVAMGLLTVAVASLLPLLVPAGMRGRIVGAGTGLAYGLCNLPAVFSSSAANRALLCSGVLVTGAVVLGLAGSREGRTRAGSHDETIPLRWSPAAVVSLVLTFLLLVWFDSAFFYIIQQTRELKDSSWEGNGQLLANAALHLLAAIVSGYLLDFGFGAVALGAAWIGLAVGATGLQGTGHSAFTACYVAGVSMYSVALVVIPSLHSRQPGDRATFLRAALLYSVSGWIGSGMGIGMAENLSRIPGAFILISAFVLLPILRLKRYLT